MAQVNTFPLTTTPLATALQSLNYALYKATSVTSLAIGTGAKVFTTQAGKDFAVGDYVIATSDADAANFMSGQIAAYSGTSLTIDVTTIGGSGTLADWTIRLSGPPGETGATGPAGPAGSDGTIAGSTGSTDNRVLRADGTGGTTLQNSPVTLDDAGNMSGVAALSTTAIEVGHASDTTVSRAAAGVLAVEGVNLLSVATGRAQGKETVWVPASAMIARITNGAAAGSVEMSTNKNMLKTLDFDTSTQEFAQFEIAFPKSWNLGTVTFQPIWSHASTTTNFGVVWGLAGVARSDDDPADVAFGTAQTSTDTGGTTNDIYIGPESSAITIAGSPAAGDTVQFQINRTVSDGGDTMAVDARLHGIRLFFTTNASTDA